MPGTTPIYGFPYPFETEPVQVTDFAALANAIDVAEEALRVQAQFQLTGRPVCKLRLASGLTSASGAGLTLTYSTTAANITDNSGMFNTGVPDRVTPTVAGVYLLAIFGINVLGGTTTIDEAEILVIVNGNYQTGERGPGYGPNVFSPILACTTLLPLNVSDTVQIQVSWAGTGGPATWASFAFLSLSYVCPLT